MYYCHNSILSQSDSGRRTCLPGAPPSWRLGDMTPVTGSPLIGGADRRLGTDMSLFLNGGANCILETTAEEQLKVRKSTEVEAKICFGQRFTAAPGEDVDQEK